MSRARVFLLGSVLPLAAVAGLAAVLAQGGRWSPRLDVLTHLAPVYVAVGVLALLVGLVLRADNLRLALAASGAAAVLGGLALIVPELTHPASPPVEAEGPGRLKVIQFNMRGGTGRLDESIRWLAAEKPDILVVEESTPALRDRLARDLGLHSACGRTCMVTILSRMPPVAVDRPRRGFYGRGPAITVARFADAAGPYEVAGVHFIWPTDPWQAENSRRMLQVLHPYRRERLILTGDFNSTPWSFARRRDDAALGIERRTRALFSWPAGEAPGFPFLPIDHVYAGPGWATVSVRRGPALNSDHYPIVAVLAANP
jgi:endonuclease/exonuclease/phosphatase (EEP) superfamily protein YafD